MTCPPNVPLGAESEKSFPDIGLTGWNPVKGSVREWRAGVRMWGVATLPHGGDLHNRLNIRPAIFEP